jgi:hypothetical protein
MVCSPPKVAGIYAPLPGRMGNYCYAEFKNSRRAFNKIPIPDTFQREIKVGTTLTNSV